jgi:hypothetical protein
MELSASQLTAAAAVSLANGRDVVDLFQKSTKAHFVDWFNEHCALKGPWAGKAIRSTPDVRTRFAEIWDHIPLMFGSDTINLTQFGALMSSVIIEAGAELRPVSELCGREGYPGLAYAFSSIPGVKQSYNACKSNKPAGELFFNDLHFWEAHRQRPLGDLVRAMPDVQALWNGDFYPQHLFPASTDPQHAGFIQEADFYKFRGRGFIQVTWRANYKRLVEYVQNYEGAIETIRRYRAQWHGNDSDAVCSMSSNEDWDTLFHDTDLVIPCRAIGLHNEASGHYLRLSSDAATLNATHETAGSFYNMGLRINGGRAYAAAFRERAIRLVGEAVR